MRGGNVRDSVCFAACKSIIWRGKGGTGRGACMWPAGGSVNTPPSPFPEPPQIVYSVNNNKNNVCTWPDSGKFLHKVANISLLR